MHRSPPLSLTLREAPALSSDAVAVRVSGPCLFDYEPVSGRWVRGFGCLGGRETGVDGDGSNRTAGVNADVIAAAGAGCILADADVRTFSAPGESFFCRDHGRGLFLIAAPSLLEDPAARFVCDLQID
ncbi:MAG: hypothetical protein AAGC92_02155 [Pseudomonadota bacterium]